jgi:hypothetical protein
MPAVGLRCERSWRVVDARAVIKGGRICTAWHERLSRACTWGQPHAITAPRNLARLALPRSPSACTRSKQPARPASVSVRVHVRRRRIPRARVRGRAKRNIGPGLSLASGPMNGGGPWACPLLGASVHARRRTQKHGPGGGLRARAYRCSAGRVACVCVYARARACVRAYASRIRTAVKQVQYSDMQS